LRSVENYTAKDVSSISSAIEYANKHLQALDFAQTREGKIQTIVNSIPYKIITASQVGWNHFSLTDVVDQGDFFWDKILQTVNIKGGSFTEQLIEELKKHNIRCYATWHVCLTVNRGWRYTLEGQF
jgi:hypothetical protein